MLFELSISPTKFRATNATWNRLRLNDPWSVGYVSTLIEKKPFANKEEWENFYYASGEQRKAAILQLAPQVQTELQNALLKFENPRQVYHIPFSFKQLNTQYGRTKEDLARKASILQQHCSKVVSLSNQEAFECVRFRVICETWNGIVVRERATVQNLQNQFPKIEFRVSDGVRDYKYAIDYELFLHNKLLGAIQIKPLSYQNNKSYLYKAQTANARKHQNYFNTYHRNVRYVYANHKGEILNTDDFLERLGRYYHKHA